eukprot:GHVN01044627.1.p1 GENE.GHVN01044627.1~~GHVN01044627.1.p1  ORF type:complete len:230 (+),score=10.35 GHVN01044627.1:106-795(+)
MLSSLESFIKLPLLIALTVVALNMFYSKYFPQKSAFAYFPTKSNWLDCVNSSKRRVCNSFLWAVVVTHLMNPWHLWDNTKEGMLVCAFLFSSIQIPPMRILFQRRLGEWPSVISPFMPTPTIASSLRQSFGPPFIFYTCFSSLFHIREVALDEADIWATAASFIATMAFWATALFSFVAGVLIRPDNDWAGSASLVGSVDSKERRFIHASLMTASAVLNVALFFYCCYG